MRLSAVAILLMAILASPTRGTEPDSSGEALYQEFCSKCHGKNLEGGNAPSLVDGVWMYGSNKERNITFGIAQQGMPAFEGLLSKDQIKAISTFISVSAKSAGATKPPIPDTLLTYDYAIRVEKWVEGLEIPWSIAFIDPSTALITERKGRLRIVEHGVLRTEQVKNTPSVVTEGQGGLLDVAVDPNYVENPWIYLVYSHVLPDTTKRRPPAMTRVVRGKIIQNTWRQEEVIYEAPHETYQTSRHHYGSRIVFDKTGDLYFSVGDRGYSKEAQLLTRPNGKVHRIHSDGRIPESNPFVTTNGALKSIFSFGHRNPQGLAVHPETGSIWSAEHGPMGGDEVNIVESGLNYGWPEISYGRNYNGTPVSKYERLPGMAQPVLFWRPSIAVCSIEFYTGSKFAKWKNRLLVSALAYEEVRLLTVEDNRVIHQEVILKNSGRVRDVSDGPDGSIYVVLNNPGIVLRLTPILEDDGF
jgi:glucose/arabinose dehydrogenase